MNRLSIEVPIFFKLRMLWNGPLRNLATQPVSWPVKIETALISPINKSVVNASETWLANAFARFRKHLLDDIRICFFYY
jgi:hypothetical protein